MNRLLEFYTDGAWSSKSEMGGWAAICVENGDIIDTQSGREPYSTNNRMELTAFLSALENIDTIETGHTKVIIYTDSAYVANCINQKWYVNWIKNSWRTSDKKQVKNKKMWLALIGKLEMANITFRKVKGHNGVELNEFVDKMAVAEVNRLKALEG